jgi:4-alpha-glucanotransferase
LTLDELAAAYGVATSFDSTDGRRVDIEPDVIRAVLAVFDVDARRPAEALAAARAARRHKPVVLREGRRLPARTTGSLYLEDGTDCAASGAAPPLGYHRLVTRRRHVPVIVTPARGHAGPPPAWGWLLQLYALRSADSWGMGDFGDLAAAARLAAADGAGFLLVNPLHALVIGDHVPASPYSPSSRRFINPLYLRIQDIPGYGGELAALRPVDAADGLIDYDAVWHAKHAALARLAPAPAEVTDPDLRDFATYCALAERHGSDWRRWPESLRRPDGPAVAQARAQLADRVSFHAWVQQLCVDQLAAAARASGGMRPGLVHDLAVGIDPGGADGWLLQDVLADGVRIGAPPDAFNQLGQDWGLAAWRPDRLAEAGYAPYRDLLRAAFRHAGGLRVDHVAGLWRLWWVPPGASARQGTYVRYDADAMAGILALEAHRAGALVIGEDLGTVEPAVTQGLASRNMLGCLVLWFARTAAGNAPLPAADWRADVLASVSTHDLPTAPGLLSGEHVRVRAELGQLAHDVETERAAAAAQRAELVALLVSHGLAGPDATDEELVEALYAFLAATPSRLIGVSPYDVLGDVRQPNLPGTVDEYPNWRLPLTATVAELFADPRTRRVVDLLRRARPTR